MGSPPIGLHPAARAPSSPRLGPARPCQAIFTSAASVIAIKLTRCRRGHIARGAAASARGQLLHGCGPMGHPVPPRGGSELSRSRPASRAKRKKTFASKARTGDRSPAPTFLRPGKGRRLAPPLSPLRLFRNRVGRLQVGARGRGEGGGGSLPGQGPALHARRSTALPLHLSSFSAATTCALTQRRWRVWVPLLPQALREQGLQEDQ